MLRRRSERGEGNLGCILWVVALGLVALIAWKAIPVKIQSSELYDYMDELAKFNSARTPPEELTKMIMDRAHGLGIPIEKGDIKVEHNGDRIFMEVDYTVPLDILGMVYRWHFHQKLDRPIFIV
ncbi:MAG TPA: hypothetical protein VGS07_03340 [Thermoanaerobaculia bacterium]|jgi:hypothetical protein|nr:hypothetical protein [Thermoanaerobaculia bacterium]